MPASSFITWRTFATFAEAKKLALTSAPNPEAVAMLTEESAVPLPLTPGQLRLKKPKTKISYKS